MRNALFNKRLKEYADNNLKAKFWEEITCILYGNGWDDVSQEQKTCAGEKHDIICMF